MTDIEAQGRELRIVKDGRVKMSPVPDGFSPQMFRHIIAWVDLLYRKNSKVPTINELLASWEDFDAKTGVLFYRLNFSAPVTIQEQAP